MYLTADSENELQEVGQEHGATGGQRARVMWLAILPAHFLLPSPRAAASFECCPQLDPEAIYIVGGIVDRNRHKLLCYNKAEEQVHAGLGLQLNTGACCAQLACQTAGQKAGRQPRALACSRGFVTPPLSLLHRTPVQGIAHARLPIGEYVRLASSQVMTTNHIIHILLHWLELRCGARRDPSGCGP